MTLQPRKDFQDSLHAKPFADAIETPWMREAIKAALLDVQLSLPPAADMGSAASCALLIRGAQIYAAALIGLTQKITPIKEPENVTQLNHRA